MFNKYVFNGFINNFFLLFIATTILFTFFDTMMFFKLAYSHFGN